jgi:PAS domain S-box-containing protein
MIAGFSVDKWVMVIVYGLLFLFWFIVLIRLRSLIPAPILPSRKVQAVRLSARVVVAVLLLDSAYWTLTNAARVGFLQTSWESTLRNNWYVALVKLSVLAAAVFFYSLLRRTGDALVHEVDRFRLSKLIEHTWDAVGILDARGKVTHWNTGAENLFGFRREDVVGHHIKSFMVPPERHHEIDEVLTQIRETRQARQNYHTARLTADGRQIPADITISPIIEGGTFQGYFGIMRESIPRQLRYILRPRYFHETPTRRHARDYVFVAMPFSVTVVPVDVWKLAISDAIVANKLEAVRADEETLTGRIIDQVYADISGAKIVVADLTGSNPNVFYEVGLAHVLSKPVIQLWGDPGNIPFDLAGIRTIVYRPQNLAKLRDDLTEAIQDEISDGIHP